ncbi:hypothetical protein AURDEDRAFT_188574 [Auricularia subglabra TFB-10046 SS5]|nr:hypothetical protein AURDEDRAFT_188574 [Auricularia subglabra TFB-10046 SS5]
MPSDSASQNDSSSEVAEERPDTVETLLEDTTARMRAFLVSNARFRMWEPPSSWKDAEPRNDDELQRARALPMPRMFGKTPYPDLLLYALGNLETLDPDYPQRLADFTSGENHIYLCDASGTGKTRLLFETLAHQWGLYLTCSFSVPSDPYGSSDLSRALNALQTGMENGMFIRQHITPSSRNGRTLLQQNRDYASLVFRRILLGRLLVLDHFCSLVRELSIPDDVARRKWLLYQLRPEELNGWDVFHNLMRHLRLLSDDQLSTRLRDLYQAHRSKLTFVAIDEAQAALNVTDRSFFYADDRRCAPLLRELVLAIGTYLPASRMIVTGVQVDLNMVSDALRAARTPSQDLRLFHDLGAFRTETRIRNYLAHFFGPDVALSTSGPVHQWLRGRHRLITNLVMFTLMTGSAQLSTVMETLVYKLTGYRHTQQDMLRWINIGIGVDDTKIEGFRYAHLLRASVLSFARGSRSSFILPHAPDFVRLGVALFSGSDGMAEIFEPFVFLTLCRWLRESRRYGAWGLIQQRVTLDTPRLDDSTLLDAIAFCLFELWREESSPLCDCLRFSGLQPPWFRQPVSLVLPRVADGVAKFASFVADSTMSLVHTAATPDQVFDWFHAAEQPFLIPDHDFGVPMLCFLMLADKTPFLACFHLPPVTKSRHRSYAPSDPCYYYRKLPEFARRLKALLQSLPDLPVTFASGTGRYSKARSRPARFGLVQIVCLANPYDPDHTRDPPVASLHLRRPFDDAEPSWQYQALSGNAVAEIQFGTIVARF